MDYSISNDSGARVRIDKWLWAARFFKTRSLAVQALGKGRVKVAGETVKPAREVRADDRIELEIDGIVREIVVRAVSEIRGPAPVARTLYEETEASVARRLAETERRRLYREPAAGLAGRPSKRDRRLIGKLGDGG
jgi:ribosome-associated heat shock protein Hsp15